MDLSDVLTASLRWRVRRLALSPPLRPARMLVLRGLRRTFTTGAPVLITREELPQLLERRGLTGRGAEVGVKLGFFSEWLLSHWHGRELVSIDPWREAPGEEYVHLANVAQRQHDLYFAETCERLRPFGSRSTVWRTTGAEGADRIPDRSLDFAYLDARHDHDHDHDSVLADLADWYPKVRPGGLITGHDYVADGTYEDGVFGVRSAVLAYFGERGLRVRSSFIDPPWFTWYVLVPGPSELLGDPGRLAVEDPVAQ